MHRQHGLIIRRWASLREGVDGVQHVVNHLPRGFVMGGQRLVQPREAEELAGHVERFGDAVGIQQQEVVGFELTPDALRGMLSGQFTGKVLVRYGEVASS